jgi:hypothetical protein
MALASTHAESPAPSRALPSNGEPRHAVENAVQPECARACSFWLDVRLEKPALLVNVP